MSTVWLILIGIIAWIVLISLYRLVVMPWLSNGPCSDPLMGLIWRVVRWYCQLVHRATYLNMNELREKVHPGPLIVVSNHTGAIDPMLIQCGCRFHIRWMMASDMMTTTLDWLWKLQQVIEVDRDGQDLVAARESIRHVRSGGVIGIFPEGRIVTPPREVRPFFTGVGLVVAKCKAPVLLVWVSGTPDSTKMSKSILTPSHARVEFLDLIDFKDERNAEAITQSLRERIAQASGWPLNDEPVPKPSIEDSV